MSTEEDAATKRRLARSEEITRFTHEALEQAHQQNERRRLSIGPAHERLLEYFWNPRTKSELPELPISVVYFFESSDSVPQLRQIKESQTNLTISELIAKGYIDRAKRMPDRFNFIVRDEEFLSLTPQGLKYLWRRHPRAFLWWTRILDRTPSYVSLLVTIIGLVASVLGILSFFSGGG